MIKIIIDKVASYKAPTVLESDKKVTLIYGLNGAGKSTLSNFLYGANPLEYANCSKQGFDGFDLLVYNTKFVRDNFFEIDKLNGIFTLSKINKEVEEKIISTTENLRKLEIEREGWVAKEKEISRSLEVSRSVAEDSIWPIKTKFSGGDRVMEYCLEGLKAKSRLFDYIAAIPLIDEEKCRPIEVIKKEVEILQGDNATSYSLIPICSTYNETSENAEIFKTPILGKSDSPIAALISKLNNADWVNEGLTYVDILKNENDEICPFCQAPTLSSSVTEVIKDYFDKTFSEAVSNLKLAAAAYQNSFNNQPDFSPHFSNPFFLTKLNEFRALHGQLEATYQANLDKIQGKIKSPTLVVELVPTAELIEKINLIVSDANKKITDHNEKIKNKKDSLAKLKNEFWLRCRRDQNIAIAAYNIAVGKLALEKITPKKEMDRLDSSLKLAKDSLVELQSKTVNVDQAISSINSRLQGMGIDSFTIVKAEENRYRISRNGSSAEDFQTLSEGEKTVISFIYFVELCKGKRNATDISSKKVAIIDDPISSLSHIYVFNIGQLIKEEFSNSDSFSHIIILTHSLYFFYELADMNKVRREANQKLLRIIKNSSGSSIADMKYEEIQNDYQAYWNVVMDENQHPALIANCMRNIIEYFFNFVKRRDLNNVFQMPSLKDTKHQAFCRFMNRESHSLGQNIFDYKEFDYQMFKEGFRLVFNNAGFPEHYIAMSK